jgi:hypothetical protein
MYRAFFERGFVIAISFRFAVEVQAQGPLLSGRNDWGGKQFSEAAKERANAVRTFGGSFRAGDKFVAPANVLAWIKPASWLTQVGQ